jgi:hypothetical protein
MRFSIRDILWLTLAVALAVGWWLDHRNQQSTIRRQHDIISRGEATYDQLNQFAQALAKTIRSDDVHIEISPENPWRDFGD